MAWKISRERNPLHLNNNPDTGMVMLYWHFININKDMINKYSFQTHQKGFLPQFSNGKLWVHVAQSSEFSQIIHPTVKVTLNCTQLTCANLHPKQRYILIQTDIYDAKNITKNLTKYGYTLTTHTSVLWYHVHFLLNIYLVSNGFLVKYVGSDNVKTFIL